MDNYNNLSKQELINLLISKDNEINKQDEIISRQKAKIERLEVEKRNLNKQIETLINKYEDKLLTSKKFQVEQFIPTSEKLKDKDLVINELEVIKNKKVRKAPTETFINDLKTLCSKEEIIDYDFKGIDTSNIKPFGEDVNYKIEYKPASFEVVKIIKKKYKDKDKIYESLSDDPFPHSPLTPSLAANLIEMKFNLGVPFYRYSNYLIAHGLNISDIDIYHYAKKTMDLLEPLYQRLLDNLIHTKYNVIHADETPLKVIGSDKDKCYMFVYASSFWDSPIYIYDFNDSRNTDKFKELLKDYKGYIVCDGYAGYDGLKKNGIRLQRCFVHARRYFIDVLKVLDEPYKSKSPAYKVVDLMAILFKYESEFIDKNYTANMIKKERNSDKYSKAIKDLDDYIYSINTSNNSLLEKAVNYYKNHKQDLYTYLDNGYLDISNNLAERVVKPFVIARKNFLFCKTADGATTTGKLFSIVQTAKANGLKSEEYLTYVINNINKVDIDDLLPFSNKIPKQLLINK